MRGDADGAIAVLRQAHKAGPHFADPLELTGEALMHKGDYQGAVAQFQMASQAAPRWGRAHLRWGQSLLRIGYQRDAKAQLNTARSSSLSVSDRAELDALPGDSLR
jgi:Flp pilus assembly protein TadD